MNNIKIDEQRIKDYYTFETGIEEGYGWFTKEWFSFRYSFLYNLFSLTEEFHRHYSRFYTLSHWMYVFDYQTELSEKFYDDFFDKINFDSFVWLIRRGEVSLGWIERNKHRIPSEVWGILYE